MPKTPSRPSTVPQEARFVPEDQEWELGERRGEKRIGILKWWRVDGTLVCESHFDEDGELDGIARRYHPDGTVSMESSYVHGQRWGKTWHSRSRSGDSPEDVHMQALPDEVCRLELVYVGDKAGPVQALLGRDGANQPPELRVGRLVHFQRDIGKYLRGTVFVPFGTIIDIAGREVDANALFFLGLATEDGSLVRVSLTPPTSADEKDWQNENATVLQATSVEDRLVVAVDFMAARIDGRPPVPIGLSFRHVDRGLAIASMLPNGIGTKLGLKPEDRLVEVNGHAINGVPDFLDAVADWTERGELKVSVLREGQTLIFRTAECPAVSALRRAHGLR